MRDSRLISPAFPVKTGGGARFFEPREESRPGLGFRRSGSPQVARCDRTGRSTFQGHPAVSFYTIQAEHYLPRRTHAFTFPATRDVLHGLDLYFIRFRYQDQPSGLKIA